MKSKYLIFTILFILIGSGSLIFGLMSCQSVNNEKTQDVKENKDTKDTKGNNDSKDKTASAVLPSPRGQVASFLIPETNSDKGVQKSLNKRSHQILDIWAAVKAMNGVINVLQSAQVKGNYFIEASVNPIEFLAPIDDAFKKLSGMFLGAYSVIVFQKMLLSLSAFLIFILIIPICALVTIVILWTYKDRTKIYRIVITSVLITLIIPFAIPFSVDTSSLLGNKILAKNINTLVATIEENGKTASSMEDDIVRSRRTGNSIIRYMDRVKTLSETIIENAINYYIIFLFIFIIIPILTLLVIFFLTRYVARLILGKK
ncbi:hypothetical protein [Treponema sp. R80B11-R83G3]